VSAYVLDAGAFIAVERDDRSMMLRLQIAAEGRIRLRTNAMIVAQIWRSVDGRNATLARFLDAVSVAAMGETEGRAAGALCGTAHTDDPIDAALALLAAPGDWIITSDPADMRHLLDTTGTSVTVVPVSLQAR
jgi:hypothetical protein